MIDIFTYIIYFGLLGTLLTLTSFGAYLSGSMNKVQVFTLEDNRILNVFHWLGLILISFVVGYRYNVGVDWGAYKNTFERLKSSESFFNNSYMEIGYLKINQWVIDMGWDYTAMFFIVALLSWFFIFISVPKKVLPLTIFFLFTDEYFFWSMNGVRQFMAISIFLYAIKFILSKDLFYYIVFISLASLFHLSALVLIPLYFLPINKLYNQKIWLLLLIASIFMNKTSIVSSLIDTIFLVLADYVPIFKVYGEYANSENLLSKELHFGLGYYLKLLTSFFIIFFSKDVIKKHPNTKVYFILFFIGAIFTNVFMGIQIVTRFITYFNFVKPVALAFIVYYLWNRKTFSVSALVCLLYTVLFVKAIYNSSNLCSPFNFTFLL
jgi:transmembrane protein EpsG